MKTKIFADFQICISVPLTDYVEIHSLESIDKQATKKEKFCSHFLMMKHK